MAAFLAFLLCWLPAAGSYKQAIHLFQQGRFQTVVDALDRLPLDEGSRPAAQNLRSLAFMNLGRFDAALHANALASEQEPTNANYVYNRGLIQSNASRLQDAEKTFRKGIERFPKSQRLHEGLGDILVKLNCFDEAERAFKTAVEIGPASGSALASLAKLYYALGDNERFVHQLREQIQNPS